MKRLRVLLLLTVSLLLLGGVLFWSRRTATNRAATPAECLDNYYDSLQSGDVEKYQNCLEEPSRAQAWQRSFEDARRHVKDVKNLVQVAGPAEGGSSRWVDVDEVRTAGVRRLRYHLRQDGRGWVIVAIDPPHDSAAPIRYGTHVGDEP